MKIGMDNDALAVEAYIAGTLSVAERTALEAQFAADASLRNRLQLYRLQDEAIELADFADSADAMAVERPNFTQPDEKKPRGEVRLSWRSGWWRVAAAVLLLIVAAYFAMLENPKPPMKVVYSITPPSDSLIIGSDSAPVLVFISEKSTPVLQGNLNVNFYSNDHDALEYRFQNNNLSVFFPKSKVDQAMPNGETATPIDLNGDGTTDLFVRYQDEVFSLFVSESDTQPAPMRFFQNRPGNTPGPYLLQWGNLLFEILPGVTSKQSFHPLPDSAVQKALPPQ
jgi:hypothetical protein